MLRSIQRLATKGSYLKTCSATKQCLEISRPATQKYLFSTNQDHPNTDIIQPQELDRKENIIRYIFGIPLSPLYLLGLGWFEVSKNHIGIITCWGKYRETVQNGLHFRMPIGLSKCEIFVGPQSYKMPTSKVVDANGNPIIVSGIVNFQVSNPEKFHFNIKQDEGYIHNQAEAVLKRVVAKYPYEDRTDDNQVSLKNETDEVNQEMKRELEKLVDKAGVQVNEFYLTDLNYAPEISQQMLIRQQARAYIDAKQEIAEAGVQIVHDTLKQLEDKKMDLNEETKNRLISNLITVIASGNNVQPTLPLSHKE
uniref:SPFH domain / band 7 family protein n=1 Tax=Marseillevirus LCMAC201 TaxID=2506605 RepID=A0A481YWE6_9VIRU|nr:MAG: SPFH domain / band 7 family protein [Marseillevirus LCMAC201]